MSREIEERVVQMRFDNKQFENGVGETLGTLDKLKKSLRFDGASKGLENLSDAAEKVSFSPLGAAVDTVKAKFSAMEIVAITALANITNSIINTGKQMVKSLTIAPINQGFNEYELKMGAVQTIMAGTGESLDTVMDKLNELNEYADKTIYSFSDMTSNIGKFTNAGVGLNDSVAAIKGVANVAAVSGANANEASRAMYNFSQALSAGYVKLIDWKSIENANMATVEFKQQLIDTAVALGTVVKVGERYQTVTTDNNGKVSDLFDATSNFNDALSAQWMTTEVLTQTLSIYSTDIREMTEAEKEAYEAQLLSLGYTKEQIKQIERLGIKAADAAKDVKTFSQMMDTLKEAVGSGWATTWELIFGDFEEGKRLWTELGKVMEQVFNGGAEGRNNLLFEGLSSSWKQFAQLGIPQAKEFSDILTYIGDSVGLDPSFNKINENGETVLTTVKDLIEESGSFSESLKKGWVTSEMLGRAIDTMAETYSNLTEEQKKESGITAENILQITELNEAVKNGTINLDEWANKLSQMSGRDYLVGGFFNILDALFKIDEATGRAVGILAVLKQSFAEIFPPMTGEKLFAITKRFYELTDRLKLSNENAEKLGRVFKGLFSILKIVTSTVEQLFGVAKRIVSFGLEKIFGVVNTDLLGMAANVGDLLTKFADWYDKSNLIGNAFTFLGVLLDAVKMKLTELYDTFINLPFVVQIVDQISTAFSNLANNSELVSGFGTILSDVLGKLQSLANINTWKPENLTKIFSDVAGSIFEYTTSITGFSTIIDGVFDSFATKINERAKTAKDGVESLGGTLSAFGKQIADFTKANIGMGEALTIVVSAGLIYYTKRVGGILNSLAGPLLSFQKVVTATSKALTGFANKLKADAILRISLALAVLAGSLIALSFVPAPQLWSAVGAIFVLGTVLTAISIAISKIDTLSVLNMVAFGKVIAGIGLAMLSIAGALKMFESLRGKDWKKTIGTFAVVLASLAGVSILLSRFSGTAVVTFRGALAIVALGAAIKLVAGALNDIQDIKISEKQISAIVFAVGGLALILKAMSGLTSFGSIFAAISVVLALKMFIGLFDDITEVGIGKIKAKIPLLIEILLSFSALMLVSKLAGKNAWQTGIMLAGISAMVFVLSKVVKSLSEINTADIAAAKNALLSMLGVFSIVMVASHFTGQHAWQAGVMLLMMSGALLTLSAALTVLSHVANDQKGGFAAAVVAVDSMMAVMALVVKSAGAIGADGFKAMVVMAVSFGLMALALGTLAMLPYESLLPAAASLGAVMLSLGGYAMAVSKMNFKDKDTIVNLINLGVFIAVAGLIVVALNELPANEGLLEKTGSLVAMLLGLSAAMWVVSKIKIDPAVMSKTAESMIIFMLAIASIIALFGALGYAIDLITKGDLEGVLENAKTIMIGLGEAIGGFVGGIVEAFVDTAVFGTMLDFADTMVEFSNKMTKFNTSSLDAAKSAIGLFAMFAGAEFIGSLTTIVENFGVGGALGSAIDLLSKLFGGGKTTEKKTTFEQFAEILPKLGEALKGFQNKMGSGIKSDVIKAGAESIKLISEALTPLGRDGEDSFLGWLSGTKDNAWYNFATNLGYLGQGLHDFSEKITEGAGIDKQAITDAAAAGTALAEFAQSIPNEGGAFAKLVGDNKIDQFASYLEGYAKALVAFNTVFTDAEDFNSADLQARATAASNAGKAMAEFAKALPSTIDVASADGYSVNTVSAESTFETMKKFTTHLPEIAKNMKSFNDELTDDFKASTTQEGADAGSALSDMAYALHNHLASIQVLSKDDTLKNFGSALSDFGSGYKSYYDYISGISSDLLVAVDDEIERWIGFATDIVRIDQSKLPSFATVLTETAKNGVEGFLSMISDNYGKAEEYASSFIQHGINGMYDKAEGIHTAIRGIVAGIEALWTGEEFAAKFKSLGEFFAEGVAQGIRDKIDDVREAAEELAAAADTGASERLDENSPSKVGEMIGSFFGEGFVSGIQSMATKAYDAASTMADAAKSGLMTGIDKLKTAVATNGPIDLQSLITGGISEDLLTSMLKDSGFVSQDVKAMLNGTYSGGITGVDLDRYLTSVGVNPVTAGITPVLDLDKAVENADSLNSVMSFWQASGINDRMSEIEQLADSQNGLGVAGNVYQFTQNNYSPKALSREEIYRQTRNQFALMKGTAK